MLSRWMLEGTFGMDGVRGSRVINPTPFRIGRRSDATLRLPRSTVSGFHAEMSVRKDRLFVRDLNSTNGTFINGERINGEVEVRERDMLQFADVPLKVGHLVRKSESRTASHDCVDHALSRVEFERLLKDGLVIPYFQPIVDLETHEIVGFEVLGRSEVAGLETPGLMFDAAADLQKEAELSNLLRTKGVEVSRQFEDVPHIFLNTHPADFVGRQSWDWIRQLRELAPEHPLTIEIHEGAVTDVRGLMRIRSMLKDFDVTLAFDDFGAGQARLAELAEIRPEYLKFDRRLIAALDRASDTRQRFVKQLVDAAQDIGVVPLAEGVETPGEAAVCRDIGFHLAQGYWFGFPGPISVYENWKMALEHSDSIVLLRSIPAGKN